MSPKLIVQVIKTEKEQPFNRSKAPKERKSVKSNPSLGETEKLKLQNRFDPLWNLNGDDPFNFTRMTEAMDQGPVKASNTPADSKNLQEKPHPQPSPTPGLDSVEIPPPRMILLTRPRSYR